MEEKNFELEIAPLTEEELDAVDGGAGESRSAWRSVRCVVKKHYLALRNHPSFKYENEIARISRGTVFSVKTDKVSGNYVWASYGGKTGWVDKRFIEYC
jgi:hypothetical protein